ncbi:MAG: HU family DNA-binding protein [Solirubrobacteraceae bacterium]
MGVCPLESALGPVVARGGAIIRAKSALPKGRAIDSLVNTVQKTLKKGDDVAITGFGKFSVAKRGARPGRHPATGATLKIKASDRAKSCRPQSPAASDRAVSSAVK